MDPHTCRRNRTQRLSVSAQLDLSRPDLPYPALLVATGRVLRPTTGRLI